MTDPVIATILVRGALAMILALGGVVCLYFGFRLLFLPKALKSESKFEASIGKHTLAFSSGAAGTSVVFVSAIWVAGSIMALPSISKTEKGTLVAAVIPFQGAMTDLAVSQKSLLDTIGPGLRDSRSPLIIEGYADTGNREMDAVLAEKRAEAVRDYLVREYDLSEQQASLVSHGEAPPGSPVGNSVVIRSGEEKRTGAKK